LINVVAEPTSSFRPGDTILMTYEVYNASSPRGAKPDMDVRYTFLFLTKGGPRPVGTPIVLPHQSSESLAYSLPLTGWPEGSFRVRVSVTDNRRGDRVERDLDFRVEVPSS
jgi:hypothetical protein